MPAKIKKSSLANKLSTESRRRFEEKKSVEAEYDTNAGLPAGIEGGIAQLVECGFRTIQAGKTNAGELMFYAAGIVVSPEEVNGSRIVGLRTQINEPICDTPNNPKKPTQADHVENVMNELKKLGVNMEEMDADDLESVCETLKEERPYFRFRTWSGTKQELTQRDDKFFVGTKGPYPSEAAAKAANPFVGVEPRVQSTWNGACEYVEDEVSGVVDETEDEEEFIPVKSQPKTKSKLVKAKKVEEDLSELAEAADNGDAEASARLMEIANENGIDEDTVNNTASWSDVVDLINGEEESEDEEDEDEEEEDEEEEQLVPEKGEVYKYKPKGKKKAIECSVTAVFQGKEVCNLKSIDEDGSVFKSVPWSELIQ
jgi:hypothetical protein